MTGFCKACGSELSERAAFCEECGQPVPPLPSPWPARPAWPDAPAESFWRKPLLLTILLFALLGTGAAYYLLREAALPDEGALTKMLNSNEPLRLAHTCLKNFDYGKSPVNVANYDNGTKTWLDLLVVSGLYSGPRHLTQAHGFFVEEIWQYEHSAAGSKAIKGNLLCFASGLVIDRIEYQPINRQGDQPLVTGKVAYHYADQAAWSQTADARLLGPRQLAENNEMQITLHLNDNHWQLGEPQVNAMPSGSTAGWLDRLSGLFQSHPEAAIIGKWHSDNELIPLHLEFRAKEVIANGIAQTVSYRAEGKNILLINHENNLPLITLTVISGDELSMQEGGIKFILNRDH